MKVTTVGMPFHNHINFLTNKGTFCSNIFDHNDYIGIQTKFISNEDENVNVISPTVNFGFDESGDLCVRIYDKTNEGPTYEIKFENGKAILIK